MTVLVTGGTSGIGRAITERWAHLGHDVLINYHNNDDAAVQTRYAVEATGRRAILIKADIGTLAGADEVVHRVREECESLDLYAHCAALAVPGGVLDIAPSSLAEAISVNGTSLVGLSQGLLPILRTGSNIIYISSRGAQAFVPSYVALGPTKSLGEAIIRYLAKELAPYGVRANTVAAGPIDTPAFRTMFGEQADGRLEAAAAANPSGRAVTFADITAAVEMLTSSNATMTQGQTLMVDGGLYL